MASKNDPTQESILNVGREYIYNLSTHYEKFNRHLEDRFNRGSLLWTTTHCREIFKPILEEFKSSIVDFGDENATILPQLNTTAYEQAREEAEDYNSNNIPFSPFEQFSTGFRYNSYMCNSCTFNHTLNHKDLRRYYRRLKDYIDELPIREDRGKWRGQWKRLRQEILASRTSTYRVIMTGGETDTKIYNELKPFLKEFKKRLEIIRSHYTAIRHPPTHH